MLAVVKHLPVGPNAVQNICPNLIFSTIVEHTRVQPSLNSGAVFTTPNILRNLLIGQVSLIACPFQSIPDQH
jgi:hypothetical protein